MECGYCENPITSTDDYQYIWFPNKGEEGKMMPVHSEHLEISKNMKKGSPYVGK